jgi:hypothetical protein
VDVGISAEFLNDISAAKFPNFYLMRQSIGGQEASVWRNGNGVSPAPIYA